MFLQEAEIRMKNYKEKKERKSRGIGTFLGWLVLAAVVLVAVPIGVIMLMVSGIWSAADRVLARWGK
ncbi:hypothetical protein B5F07_01545 [Lachnoclostridium sp. An169]|nr:hypothetical protein B5F07_01545 [Lachnoclostridium sp. An169]